MRMLEAHEYAQVGGAGTETVNVYTPLGTTITTTLEANQSTTITLNYAGHTLSWNSGVYMSCALIGAGVGIAVTSFSGNPLLGSLAASATAFGCSTGIKTLDEDGDEYGG